MLPGCSRFCSRTPQWKPSAAVISRFSRPPSPAPPLSTRAMAGMDGMLGAQLRITTNIGDEVEGELFCMDIGASNMVNSVVLCQRLENGNVNYVWTKSNIIKEVAATAPPTRPPDESQPYVDLRQVAALADKLQEAAAQDAKRYGVGVTEYAQDGAGAPEPSFLPMLLRTGAV